MSKNRSAVLNCQGGLWRRHRKSLGKVEEGTLLLLCESCRMVAYIGRAYSLRQVQLTLGTVDPFSPVQWYSPASLLAAMQLHD